MGKRKIVFAGEGEHGEIDRRLIKLLSGWPIIERRLVDLTSESSVGFLSHGDIVVLSAAFPAVQAATSCLVASLRSSGLPNSVVAATNTDVPDALIGLLEAGAEDYFIAPFDCAQVVPRVHRLMSERTPQVLGDVLPEGESGIKGLIGQSDAFIDQVRTIPAIASCDASALILGETGTGKELCARAIHYFSPRANRPFVPVNCGAIPVELAENELFGHQAGAFTGAGTAAAGLVHQAEGGTLFLDEIDSLPLAIQVKLLRFLQDKEYRQLGSHRSLKANVRILAATNGDIDEAIRTGRFRQDLFYRLNLLTLALPPLRERLGDIPVLADYFLKKFASANRKAVTGFSKAVIQVLSSYHWPGNVRELENVVGRSVLMAETSLVERVDLPSGSIRKTDAQSFKCLKAQAVTEFERRYLTDLLAANGGNISKAARAAKKDRRALWELIRKHHIPTKEPEFSMNLSKLGARSLG